MREEQHFFGFGMKRLLIFILVIFLIPIQVKADSDADCAIWICLPGGFPSGCEAAFRAYRGRIKHDRPPLPKLSSCTTGPNGEKIDGKYELGHERYELCKTGFVLRYPADQGRSGSALCVKGGCRNVEDGGRMNGCESYQAIKRAKPNYVKMWVNGDYLGQFFY